MPAVRDPCDFELALRDQSIEQCPQCGRAELVPEDAHVVLIPSVEVAGAGPTHRTLNRERLLLTGEVVDASVQDPRKPFPLVSWDVVEGRHEAATVRAGSDTTPPPRASSRAGPEGQLMLISAGQGRKADINRVFVRRASGSRAPEPPRRRGRQRNPRPPREYEARVIRFLALRTARYRFARDLQKRRRRYARRLLVVQGGSRPAGSGERDDCLDLDRHPERQLAGPDR
jgi:hypothetical protein